MARRRRDPDADRTLVARQAALTSLTQHPNWPELVAEVGRKRTRIEKIVITKTLGNKPPADSHELAYLAGFVHGMEWFASVPEMAEGALERYLRNQGVTLE